MLETAKKEDGCNAAIPRTQKPRPTRKGNCNTGPEQRDSAAVFNLRWMDEHDRTGRATDGDAEDCVSLHSDTLSSVQEAQMV